MTPIDDAPDAAPDAPDIAVLHPGPEVNVGHFERGASITLGSALLALAASRRRTPARLALGLVGGYLAWRGASGHCALYDALDTGSAEDEEDERLDAGAHDDASVETAATIARAPDEVYAFAGRLSNAPRYMAFLESVEEFAGGRSRWRARRPGGRLLEWEAEILEDVPGRLLVWRSQPGSLVHHAGALRLQPAPGDRGTEVRLEIEFETPGAPLARAVARRLGFAEEYAVDEDLRRLKQILEAGETATTRGQPQGRADTVSPS